MEAGTQYLEVDLDKVRKLRFTVVAIRDAGRRLGANGVPASLGDLLARLGVADVDALHVLLWYGLRHEDRRLALEDIERIVQDQVDRGRSVPKLCNLVAEGLAASGIVTAPGDEGNARTPASSAPAATPAA